MFHDSKEKKDKLPQYSNRCHLIWRTAQSLCMRDEGLMGGSTKSGNGQPSSIATRTANQEHNMLLNAHGNILGDDMRA